MGSEPQTIDTKQMEYHAVTKRQITREDIMSLDAYEQVQVKGRLLVIRDPRGLEHTGRLIIRMAPAPDQKIESRARQRKCASPLLSASCTVSDFICETCDSLSRRPY